MTALSDNQPLGVASGTQPNSAGCNDACNDGCAANRLARLVRTHQAALWRYLRYLGASPPEADDLLQETFLSVARTGFADADPPDGASSGSNSSGGFIEQSEPQTARYLRTAARNQLLMLRRRQKREINAVALEAAEEAWAAEGVSDREDSWEPLLDRLDECLDRLAGRPRRAIYLHYQQGAGRAAIAKLLGMKPDGVKTLLRRARQRLRDCLEATTAEA